MPAVELTDVEHAELLSRGHVELVGRLRWASNSTFLARVEGGGVDVPAIYKPRRGERPLWDFPEGTLHRREVAAYEVSRMLDWDLAPVTVLRDDGPLGGGSIQGFVDHDPEEHFFTLLPEHAERFVQLAVFDVLVNNADRKAGHCLLDRTRGVVVGIDHGLTFNAQPKLRTVIWDFAGQAVPPGLAADVGRLLDEADQGTLAARLAPLLAPEEIAAFAARAADLLQVGELPHPLAGYHSVPWPLV